jgi:hypothetical protein
MVFVKKWLDIGQSLSFAQSICYKEENLMAFAIKK